LSLWNFLFGSGESGQLSRNALSIDRMMVQKKWTEILELLKLGGPSRFRSAIIEADKLLDYCLQRRGFPGNNLGERLKFARKYMKWEIYDLAWKAHKVRNKIVHDYESEVLYWEAEEAIKRFEKVLKELGGL